jgi:ribosomal protein S17E
MVNYQNKQFIPMLETIASKEFKKIVNEVGGYDTSQTGKTTFL